MSLSIFISNDINELADELCSKVEIVKNNAFVPHQIVIQTRGMNQWLKYKIAENTGIAANIQFVTPEEIIYNAFKILGGSYKTKIHRQHIDWLIYRILGYAEFKKLFPIQYAYYAGDGGIDALKKWEFSNILADLFDQYQIYRTSMIGEWNVIQDIHSLPKDQQWQAYIWKQTKDLTENGILDMSEIATFISNALQSNYGRSNLKAKMPNVNLFGISIVTPLHLRIIYELSQYVDFQWYINNPSPETFWYEDISEKEYFFRKLKGKNIEHISIGNTLLTSWGKVIQNTFRMMFQSDEYINAISDLPSQQPTFDTLLSTIQGAIFSNMEQLPAFSSDLLTDGTIQIASNFTIYRELEGLLNYILNIIQKNQYGAIKERDIIVMIQDINSYAPYIRAVMDNAPYKFQYNIADESISNKDSIISALLAILDLNASQFTSENTLKLLNFKKIRKKFDIDNVELIRIAVKKANIHFGIENDFHHNIDDTFIVSWKYGIQKIMFGLCMSNEQRLELQHPLYTVECADNISDMLQITAFVSLVESLASNIRRRNKSMTLIEWKSFIEEILDTFLVMDEQDKDDLYTHIIDKFNQYELLNLFISDETVSYDVFSSKFCNSLQNDKVAGNFMTRGITFCSPLPFRSIPFKVVAILGLNHDKFPRKEHKVDFDLIASNPQLGDRNIKNNDKHLFLESILSANSAIYLSYIGRSVKNNKELPPSILVDEFLDYIQTGTNVDVRKTLTLHHPLYSYSIEYNGPESDLPLNYLVQKSNQWPIIIDINRNSAEEKPEFDISKVWLFYEKSPKYYYNNVLGIYFDQESEAIGESEVFHPSDLERWNIRNQYMEATIQGKSDEIFERMYLDGMLPLKNVGKSTLNAIKRDFEQPINSFFNLFDKGTEVQKLEVDFTYLGKRFFGVVSNILDNTVFLVSFKKASEANKDKARLAFNLLIAQSQNPAINKGILFCKDKTLTINCNNPDQSINILHHLFDFFLKNNSILILHHMDTYSRNGKIEDIQKEMNSQYVNGYNQYFKHAKDLFYDEQNTDIWMEMNDIFKNLINLYEA